MSNAYSSEPFLSSSSPIAQTPPAFDMKVDFFDALSSWDIGQAASVFADDGVLLFPGVRPMQGRPLVKRMLGIIRRRFKDIRWEPMGPPISTNGWLVTSWSVRGVFVEGDLPYLNEVLSLARLDAEGKIAMLSDYFRDTQAFQVPRPTTVAARELV